MLYSADDAKAADRRTTQYFEMFGNRGIYHEGWVACTRHSHPVAHGAAPRPRERRVGALRREDGLQRGGRPRGEDAREGEGAAGGVREGGPAATTSSRSTTGAPSASTRPSPAAPTSLGGRKSLTVFPGMTGMLENAFINVKGVHHTITAEVVAAATRRRDGRDHRAGRLLRRVDPLHEGGQGPPRVQLLRARADEHRRCHGARARQAHDRVRVRPRRGASPARAAGRSCSVDGQKVAEGHIPKTQPFVFSADEGADVGLDAETNVSPDYKQGEQRLHGQDREGRRRAEVAARNAGTRGPPRARPPPPPGESCADRPPTGRG